MFAVEFDPSVTGTTNLKFDLLDTILLKDPNGVDMTGLDCNTTMTVEGFPTLPASQYTGDGFGRAGDGGTRVCLDPESINLIDDNIENGFWITDEYGPLMYKFDPTGLLLEAIAPPEAFLPLRKGVRSFASNNPPIYNPDLDVGDNDSGRTDNQGFEGSALSTDETLDFFNMTSLNLLQN
ncbi:unnamed protein product [[Candida] boidinii]|nr:unnamed protein product [[Candida] boidinii]